jgi:hypothetical protein
MSISKKGLALLLLGTTLTSCIGNVSAETPVVKSNAIESQSSTETIARQKWMDKMFYSINKNVELDSPVWMNEESKRNAYGEVYMKTLIQEAHKIGKRYLKYGDHEAYNSFMILALTFPMHEGLYMSYRQTNDQKGLCYRKANNGDIMFVQSKKKIFNQVNENLETEVASEADKAILKSLESDEDAYAQQREQMVDDYTRMLLDEKKDRIANTDKASNYRHFIKYLKSGDKPFIAECDNIVNDQVVRQIIRGADGTDIGPVQLSLRWHYDKFLAKKMYLSLRDTFKYGLNFIHAGFKKVYYDADKVKKSSLKTKKSSYSCIISNKSINFKNLVRGSWAGKYNQGQTHKACRIADVEKMEELAELKDKLFKSKKVKKRIAELEKAVGHMSLKRHPDYHFKNNLKKAIKFIEKDKIGYSNSLSFKLDSNTRAAVDEIVNNFNDGKPTGTTHKAVSNL